MSPGRSTSRWVGMRLRNSTELDTDKLRAMLFGAVAAWPSDGLDVAVRYSRGAEFSGTCYYKDRRIYINLGRNNRYPYRIATQVAKPASNKRYWWREIYSVQAADAYQLVLFVFLHEFYHWLVKKARRNVRQKEGRCDRFATRVLVDRYGAIVLDTAGGAVPRAAWDFQDLDGFVAAARGAVKRGRQAKAVRRASRGVGAVPLCEAGGQLLLFDPGVSAPARRP